MRYLQPLAVIALLLFAGGRAGAQAHNPSGPCASCDRAYVDSVPHITLFPPLRTDMPLDVLRSYVILDSLCRNTEESRLDSMYDAAVYSDTSTEFFARLYSIADWDPLTFYSWQWTYAGPHQYKIGPNYLHDVFLNHVWKTYPDSGRSAVLGSADMILHVVVVDKSSHMDSNAILASHYMKVAYQVLDTIKGRVLPLHAVARSSHASKHNGRRAPIRPVGYFEYSPEWFRLPGPMSDMPGKGHLVWFDGSPWIKRGREYIVFLHLQQLTDGDQVSYFTVWPLAGGSTMGGMYPVENGRVDDRYNDWGMGKQPTIAQFVRGVRSRIAAVFHP